jgi:hypothetical protein
MSGNDTAVARPTRLAVAATPEVREYRAAGVVDDEEIGLPSVAVEIVFAG